MTAKGMHHTEETKRRISETKRREKNRAPLVPQPCACGCGELAAVDERRNRVAKFRSGHNGSRRGQSPSDETRALISDAVRRQMATAFPGAKPKDHPGAHHSWKWMMGRCYDSWNASFPHYGGRGIVVCAQWHSFDGFFADMADRPEGTTLDRINGDGNYEPGNCRWATKAQQSANRRDPGGWKRRRAAQGN